MHCQNLHVDTTPTTITSKYICKCSVYGKTWYESQVVNGNSLALLGVKCYNTSFVCQTCQMPKPPLYLKKSRYDEIYDEFPDVF